MPYFFYRLGVLSYVGIIHIAGLFNSKARLWVSGRVNWEEKLSDLLNKVEGKNRPLYWIHCASLGEFEQGRPLIEGLKKENPNCLILLSFFSPSGYELRKNYPLADVVAYLPADSPIHAKKWIDLFRPKAVFFIKYEFWYHYLKAINQQEIPLFLVSAVFRPKQLFFKPWGGFFRKMLSFFDSIFVQNESSQRLLNTIGIESIVVGDTRIDRVLAIKSDAKRYPTIENFVGEAPVLVCGSTWPADEIILAAFIKGLSQKGWKVIIAPHEVDNSNINNIHQRLKVNKTELVKYSTLLDVNITKASILIIDNIGMLSSIYHYAKLAYIGGGFGKGIHNTLEAVVYEIPVLFGPKHKKFVEAEDLLKLGVAFELSTKVDVVEILNKLNFNEIQKQARQYLITQNGATQRILDCIEKVK